MSNHAINTKKFIRLGRTKDGDLKIVLYAALQENLGKIECRVFQNKVQVFSNTTSPINLLIGNYLWVVKNLIDSMEYQYRFYQNGEELFLSPYLSQSDLKGIYYSFGQLKNPFLFASCHGIHYSDNPWGMMKKLFARIQNKVKPVSDFLRAGDQYYCDKIASVHIPLLETEITEEKIISLRKDLIQNAFEHMDNPELQKALAQVPSLWIGDDHDFDDGWGSSPLRFENEKLKPAWEIYRKEVIELYKQVQQVGNPEPIFEKPESSFSWSLESKEMAFFALDLRTERTISPAKIMDTDSKQALLNGLTACQSKVIFIISPILPFKNDPDKEDFTQNLGKAAREFLAAKEPTDKNILQKIGFWFRNTFNGQIKEIEGIEDDASDSLTAKENRPFLAELLECLQEVNERGQKIIFLSGDVHNASSVEAEITSEGKTWKTYLFISSPLSYKPMDRMVEAKYRKVGETVLALKNDLQLKFFVHSPQSDRNFGEIRPEMLLHGYNGTFILHQEKSESPRLMPVETKVVDLVELQQKEQLSMTRNPDLDL